MRLQTKDRSHAVASSDRTGRAALDVAGILTVAVLTTVAATRGTGDAGPQITLMAAAAAALIGGRALGSIQRTLPPILVAAAAGVIAATWRSDLIGTGPLGGPFGYENATGAFFVQAALAGAMVGVAVRRGPVAILGVMAAMAFGFVAVQASTAAALSLATAVAAAPAVLRPRWARPAVLAAAALFVLILMTTVFVGASYRDGDGAGGAEGALRSVLTGRRVVLWHESLEILRDHPGGVGPGRFDEVAPTALVDQDARWAHNAFLQQGVELGRVGLALTVLVFLWGFARLWVHPAPDGVVALGAAALAALGIHASVDYILHFPAVPLAAAALVGAAQVAPHRRSSRERDEPRQEGVEGGARPSGVAGPPSAG